MDTAQLNPSKPKVMHDVAQATHNSTASVGVQPQLVTDLPVKRPSSYALQQFSSVPAVAADYHEDAPDSPQSHQDQSQPQGKPLSQPQEKADDQPKPIVQTVLAIIVCIALSLIVNSVYS